MESSAQELSHGIFLKLFHGSCKASDFSGRVRTDIFPYTETLSYMDFCDDHLVGSSLLRTHIWFNLCTIMCIKQIGASLQFCQILGLAVAVGLNVLQGSRLGWGAVPDDII